MANPLKVRPIAVALLGVLVPSLLAPALARADEGMWPYNMAPVAEVKAKHGFEMTNAWLDHAMKSSVRFNNGGSGSFVSKKGLVMTNHHVGADCIQKLSNTEGNRDYMKEGFYARTPVEEQRCPDLELNQLFAIDDVTEKVNAATQGKTSEKEKNDARNAEIARLEKACADETGGRCDVVTLYAGGAYHLYKYRKYTDVRLVFAPEFEAAFFGGDPDNFTYPRYDLDVAFFRVYQEDKPLDVATYFPFSAEGAKEGELVFVSGHPGSTDRFATVSKLELLRDTVYPFVLTYLKKERDVLRAYMDKGPAEERAARDDYFGVENSIKALTGYQAGLTDAELNQAAKERERKLLDKVRALPDVKERTRLIEAWPKMAQAYQTYASFYRQYAVTERAFGPAGGALASRARHLLRLSEELPKPSGERLREYRDSQRKSLELSLFSTAPIDEGLEIEKIAFGLRNMQEVLGAKNELVTKLLAGKTPRQRAEEVVKGTKVDDVAFRKQLYEGGKAAVDAAKDPLIEMMRDLDETARFLRKRYEDEVEAKERDNAGKIAEAWAKAFGTSLYPDATFTLRLNHGVVKGYEDDDGDRIPWRTQLGGMYLKHKRAGGKEPYSLPKRWLDAMPRVDFTTPFNFVSTNDIIGGNSGSPVFNREGRIVGLIFDGNLPQLPNRFVYREGQARSVSVHAKGILHALDRIYGAKGLVRELLPSEKLASMK